MRLTFVAKGDQLEITGRHELRPLVLEIMSRKADVLLALQTTDVSPEPPCPRCGSADTGTWCLRWRHARQSRIAPAPESHPDEQVFTADGWINGTINPDEVPPCPICGSLTAWQSLAKTWRCARCDPPLAANRLSNSGVHYRFPLASQEQFVTNSFVCVYNDVGQLVDLHVLPRGTLGSSRPPNNTRRYHRFATRPNDIEPTGVPPAIAKIPHGEVMANSADYAANY